MNAVENSKHWTGGRADHDWLYKDEMLEMEKQGKIQLYTAFSRQQPKQYVQDRMRQDTDTLVDWILKQKAYVYICGDGNNMARDVQGALVEILSSQLEDDDPKVYLENMKNENRFVMDIWMS